MNEHIKAQEEAIKKQMAMKQAQEAMVKHVLVNQDKYPDLFCLKCGSQYFDQGFKAKAVSQFDQMNKLGEPQAVHMQIWICRSCDTELHLVGDNCNMIEKVKAKDAIN